MLDALGLILKGFFGDFARLLVFLLLSFAFDSCNFYEFSWSWAGYSRQKLKAALLLLKNFHASAMKVE